MSEKSKKAVKEDDADTIPVKIMVDIIFRIGEDVGASYEYYLKIQDLDKENNKTEGKCQPNLEMSSFYQNRNVRFLWLGYTHIIH